jgi:hypothetical protein
LINKLGRREGEREKKVENIHKQGDKGLTSFTVFRQTSFT